MTATKRFGNSSRLCDDRTFGDDLLNKRSRFSFQHLATDILFETRTMVVERKSVVILAERTFFD